MSVVRAGKHGGAEAKASAPSFLGNRKQITKEDRQEAGRFSDVVLCGYQLPTRKHILPFANALTRNKFLREIEMRDCCLCAASLETLCAALTETEHLTSVNFAANTLDRGLKTGTSEHGEVEYAQDMAGVKALVEVVSVQKLVTFLGLSKNGLDWRTAELVGEYLGSHPALEHLDLSINHLGSKGAVYLAKLLKANEVLRRLNLRSNNVGTLGLDLLCRSLRANKVGWAGGWLRGWWACVVEVRGSALALSVERLVTHRVFPTMVRRTRPPTHSHR
jgi:hypothetical protein